MPERFALVLAAAMLPAAAIAQTTRPVAPIDTSRPAVLNVAEFASIPDVDGQVARMMLLIDEPGTKRLFVNDMRGPIYGVSYDGKTVTLYVDVNDSTWGVNVQSQGRERGVQSFAFHPQFGQAGASGYGKFYTWADSRNNQGAADFLPGGGSNTHHTVLHEWTARNPAAATYDGEAPREIFRFEQPFSNHNGGMAAFNPLARPGTADFGLLYVGIGDGGSGGDPLNSAQNLANGFGKIFRIDPLGRDSKNGKYGIPKSNPFADARTPEALREIFAYGFRNPQRFAWDPKNGNMFVSDIGQGIIEEINLVTAGANLGWNVWEGSFRYAGRQGVDATNPRGDPKMTFPLAEYVHGDPSMSSRAAITGVHVFRGGAIQALRNKVMFGDMPSGEILYFDADNLPKGGSQDVHRVLLKGPDGQPARLLDLIRQQNTKQGKTPAGRADLRFGAATDGRVFLLNKADGTIRVLVP
ncbi:MAG: PQQ-dependent sugar dehydrogenase [Gemmatimonadaceae bacterium]